MSINSILKQANNFYKLAFPEAPPVMVDELYNWSAGKYIDFIIQLLNQKLTTYQDAADLSVDAVRLLPMSKEIKQLEKKLSEDMEKAIKNFLSPLNFVLNKPTTFTYVPDFAAHASPLIKDRVIKAVANKNFFVKIDVRKSQNNIASNDFKINICGVNYGLTSRKKINNMLADKVKYFPFLSYLTSLVKSFTQARSSSGKKNRSEEEAILDLLYPTIQSSSGNQSNLLLVHSKINELKKLRAKFPTSTKQSLKIPCSPQYLNGWSYLHLVPDEIKNGTSKLPQRLLTVECFFSPTNIGLNFSGMARILPDNKLIDVIVYGNFIDIDENLNRLNLLVVRTLSFIKEICNHELGHAMQKNLKIWNKTTGYFGVAPRIPDKYNIFGGIADPAADRQEHVLTNMEFYPRLGQSVSEFKTRIERFPADERQEKAKSLYRDMIEHSSNFEDILKLIENTKKEKLDKKNKYSKLLKMDEEFIDTVVLKRFNQKLMFLNKKYKDMINAFLQEIQKLGYPIVE